MSSRIDSIKQAQQKAKEGLSSKFKKYLDFAVLDDEGLKQYKPSDGNNFIRILPPADEKAYFGYDIYVHHNIGPSNDAYLCRRRTKEEHPELDIDGTCPICERANVLKNQGMEWEDYKYLIPTTRFIFFVVDYTTAESKAEGPKVFDAPPKINDGFLAVSVNRRNPGDVIDISDPDEGYEVSFTRKGSGIKTQYDGFKLEGKDRVPDDWLDLPFFDEILIIPSDEDMLESMQMEESGTKEPKSTRAQRRERRTTTRTQTTKTEEEEPEEKPTRKRKQVQEPVEEPVEEEEADEIEEETEQPKKASEDLPAISDVVERARRKRRTRE